MSTPAHAVTQMTRPRNAPARPRWSHATKNAQAKRALWVSGPLLDRIDIHVQVPRVPYEKLTGERLGESSPVVAARVEAARERQRKRFASHDSRDVCNADMTPADVRVREACKLDATGQSLMRLAMQQLQLSARAFHCVLKIARTIARLRRGGE